MKQRSDKVVGIVLLTVGSVACMWGASPVLLSAAGSGAVLVVVDGVSITQEDLDTAFLSQQIPEEKQAKAMPVILESLVEQQLLRRFLTGQRVRPNLHHLENQVAAIKELIQKRGADPESVLQKLGYDEKRLRSQLALPLMWDAYVDRVVTTKSLRDYWDKHRPEFDGTELRASHIIIKLDKQATAADWTAAETKLAEIRTQIQSGKMSFEEAARVHSDAPSKTEGGDVGFFPYHGRMPSAFSAVAFQTKEGDISPPFRSPFGVHILKVTGRRPGQLSLEDVRSEVRQRLAADMRRDTIGKQRLRASIEWKTSPPH